MRILFAALLFLLPALATAQDRGNTILVLDASGSMWGQIDGVNKIVIARDVITEMLQGIPADQNLGLTVYGHRTRGDCTDIETIVPPGPDTRDAIAASVAAINPLGKTPMTDAVIAAAEALRYTEEKATVILISDGIETCNPDPCAAAKALEEAGIDFTVHVIGFDVTDAEALRQMQCLADETGGLLRSASNAEEFLAALREVVAEPEPEPEPDPIINVSVTFNAVLDDDIRTQITDPIHWTLTSGDTAIFTDEVGNPIIQDLGLGNYTITAAYDLAETSAFVNFAIIGPDPQTFTVALPVPVPAATLDAPDRAPAGSTIQVGWTGPDEANDNIEIGLPGDTAYLSYAYTKDGNPVNLILPAQPGVYELRYKLRDTTVIATRMITVTEAEVALTAPDSAPIGTTIDVGWTGPNAPNDNIELGVAGTPGYIDYAYVKDGNPVQIIMPPTPGTYELRYRFRDSETIAVRVIEATNAEVTLTAPDAAPIGSTIDVGWTGPAAENDNVELGRPGEPGYIDYSYVKDGNPVQIILPAEPGTYELRYRFRDSETIATRAIEVTEAEISLTAPDTAPAGSTISVAWVGPNAPNDNIQIGTPGGSYITYTYTSSGNPLQIILPTQPGMYELRYSFRDTDIILTQPIEATAVTAQIVAQASVVAGENVTIGWDGPNYASDYIAIGLPGNAAYDSYAYTNNGNPLTIIAPGTPGEYEIRYMLGDTILATVPLTVTAP